MTQASTAILTYYTGPGCGRCLKEKESCEDRSVTAVQRKLLGQQRAAFAQVGHQPFSAACPQVRRQPSRPVSLPDRPAHLPDKLGHKPDPLGKQPSGRQARGSLPWEGGPSTAGIHRLGAGEEAREGPPPASSPFLRRVRSERPRTVRAARSRRSRRWRTRALDVGQCVGCVLEA